MCKLLFNTKNLLYLDSSPLHSCWHRNKDDNCMRTRYSTKHHDPVKNILHLYPYMLYTAKKKC